MNISQPVASQIESVSFAPLTSEDIQKLSVKRITTSTTFDSLLHPVPGGLYDPALGAFLDNACATCHLDVHSCPGHCGHIELPVNVYHCLYMDQAYRLLRAQCQYCHRLKMSRIEVNLYWCKLRLIKYGLLKEAQEVEDIGLKGKQDKLGADEGEGEDVSEDDDTNNVIEQRRHFVSRSLKHVERKRKVDAPAVESEAVSEARKTLLKEFHGAVVRSRKCANCKGLSAQYRKNKYTSIFRKPLSMKDRSTNVQNGIKGTENPLILLNKIKKEQAAKLWKHAQARAGQNGAIHIDEGVADMDDSSHEEFEEPQILDGGEKDSEEESGEDIQTAGDGSLIQTESNPMRARKKQKDPEEGQVYVNANEIHASLVQLFDKEKEILSMVYSGSKTVDGAPSADMFFIQHLIVPPNRYRKESKTGGADEISEAADNTSYRNILSACEEIYTIRREIQGHRDESTRRIRDYSDLQNSWLKLQDAVNSLIDKEKNTTKGLAALRIPQGIKQKLEKKEGLFRMNMMGKRVNFAARSVISPDPNIETNEIGVPPVFAKKLTYPEPVTTHSFEELKQAVINGPDKWPGAAAVEYENGQVINLRHKNQEERTAIANLLMAPSSTAMTGVRNKKVHRHLNNGDVVIMNRQPTLHKASMMVHRARVLPGEKTIRMHYANCNSYNADFDGDEMNMHFPQNEIARAEALMIADTDHQYISATAGQPLRGLIQDHLTMGVWLTCLDSFFTREEYQQLLYAGIRPEHNHTDSDRIKTMEPALMKPSPRWTGKQVISTVLLNIKPHTHAHLNLHSKSQVTGKAWGPDSEEGSVVFKDGELCTGILDKKQIGQSAGGLVHAVYEAYGHTIAGRLLSILGRLLTRLLSMRAFSCGVEDLILTDAGEQARREALKPSKDIGLEVAAKYVSLQDSKPKSTDKELLNRLEAVFRDEGKQEGLDRVTNSRAGELSTQVTRACLPEGLIKLFPQNQMQSMTSSGAKGSIVNANLISCNLGQQVLEGRRVPIMISGKSLPSFKPFEQDIRAGGYIVDRFLTGVRPQEYFFHTMAGREGLIDTAVKTSRSGYLQRCLIKGMEGLRAEYDSTVRDADGSIIQTIYGEDGLDVTKSSMLTNFKFVAQNFLSLFASLNVRDELDHTSNAEAQEWNKVAIKKVRKSGDVAAMDPAISTFPPASNAGSTSEKYYLESKKYLDENPDRLIKSKKQNVFDGTPKGIFENLLHINYLKAVIAAGEAVGVVAAQSIGEPSTQMTLNTFHLAGHSAKNVTLGIPRLREILMTASMAIKTPAMLMYPIPELPQEQVERFAKGISRISLAEVIDETDVEERLGSGIYPEARIYKIHIKFYPADEYLETYGVSKQDVVRTLETKFLPLLQKRIREELKKRKEEKTLKLAAKSDARPEIGESVARVIDAPSHSAADHEGGDSDDEDGGDDDATDAKKRTNRDEGVSYEDPDEEDEAVLKAAEREEEAESDDEDEGYGGSPRESDESGSDNEGKANSKKLSAKDRESRIMNKIQDVTSFSFDDKTGSSCEVVFQYAASTAKLLLLSLVNAAARDALIQSVTAISSCSVSTEDATDPVTKEKVKVSVLNTDGANLLAMRDYQGVINPHRIFTNDIGAMLKLYGVEAARSTIIRELSGVFESHSIKVDPRHLTLVADWMTRAGGFAPFNRNGFSDKTSPFAKMSFETTFGFLRDAVCEGGSDDLSSPSARISVGKVNRVGTGMFDVLTPVA